MHKLNDYASMLVDKLEQMYMEEDFDGELQELYEEYEDKMTKYCQKLYPDCDVCIWDYDAEYDNCDLEEKLQEYIDWHIECYSRKLCTYSYCSCSRY